MKDDDVIQDFDRLTILKILKEAYSGSEELNLNACSKAVLLRKIFMSLIDRIETLENRIVELERVFQDNINLRLINVERQIHAITDRVDDMKDSIESISELDSKMRTIWEASGTARSYK